MKKVLPLSKSQVEVLTKMHACPLSATLDGSALDSDFDVAAQLANIKFCKMDYCNTTYGVSYSITQEGKNHLESLNTKK